MGKLSPDRKSKLFGCLMVAPALLFLICFIVYPLIYNVYISLHDVKAGNLLTGERPFVGLANYVSVFKGRYLLNSIKVTLLFTLGCILVQFPLGFFLAIVYTKKAKPLKKISGLLLIAYIMPVTVTGIVFKFFFLSTGVLNSMLSSLGLIKENIEWLSSTNLALFSVTLTNIWTGIAFNMILLQSGLINIPQELYESSMIDGANSIQQFFKITLPLMKNSIYMVLILGFIYTFRNFELIYVMTSGGPNNATELLSIYSYRRSFMEFNFGEGAAIAIVMLMILLVFGVMYMRILRKEDN